MSEPADRRSLDDAIVVDEIGIQMGRYGAYLLKTLYQPIFSPSPDGLKPVAVDGLVRPYREGKPVEASSFLGKIKAKDRFFVESLCRVLHLRNFHNIGEEGLGLFLNFDPSRQSDFDALLEHVRGLREWLVEDELEPDFLVCEITGAGVSDQEKLHDLAAEMRRHGARPAIDGFGAGNTTLKHVRLVQPNVVKIDGAWFRRIAELEPATRLLESLVRSLQRNGARVLVEGIETAEQLKVALDTGAELLQGFLLAEPALAGTIFNTTPLNIEALLQPGKNVVALPRANQKD